MDAFFARNRLSAYLDGSLDESEAAEVESALERDAGLRAEYETMKRAVLLLRERGPVSAPSDLHAKIMRRVAQEPAPAGNLVWLRRPWSRLPLEGLALAAAALLVVVAIQWKPEREPTPPPPEPEQLAKVAQQEATPVAAEAPAQGPPVTASTSTTNGAPKKSLALGKTLPVSPSTRVGSAPDEPYVAEWEKQEKADASLDGRAEDEGVGMEDVLTRGVEMRTAMYYRLTTVDPAALDALEAVAERVGGRLVDSSGDPASPTELTTERNYTKVSLVIPPGQLGEATTALRGLGAVADPAPATSALYAADQVVLVLEVLYKP